MLARPHLVLGWLHCQPEDSRRLLDRQLTHRDHSLEADPSFSGTNRASLKRPGSTGCRRLSLNPSTETSSPPMLQRWNAKSPTSAARLNGSPAACSIREIQLWISGNVSNICWRARKYRKFSLKGKKRYKY